MTTSIPFQRRKCDRLLEDEELSRRELGAGLAGIEGLEEWILERATSDGFIPTSVDEVLRRFGTAWVRGMAGRYFAHALVASRD